MVKRKICMIRLAALMVVALVGLVFSGVPVFAAEQTITLSWDATTAREDGSAIKDGELDHYTIHSVDNSGNHSEITVPASDTSYSMPIDIGSYTFAISVTDVYGLHSQLSVEQPVNVLPLSEAPVLTPPIYRLPPGPPGGFSKMDCSSNISCTFK